MKDSLKANTYLFNVMSSLPKNVERLKTIKSYPLIQGLLHKMHADQNILLYLTILGTPSLPVCSKSMKEVCFE